MAMIKDALKVTPEFLNQVLSEKICYKNNDWIYRLNRDGNITIVVYLGAATENLIVPEKNRWT